MAVPACEGGARPVWSATSPCSSSRRSGSRPDSSWPSGRTAARPRRRRGQRRAPGRLRRPIAPRGVATDPEVPASAGPFATANADLIGHRRADLGVITALDHATSPSGDRFSDPAVAGTATATRSCSTAASPPTSASARRPGPSSGRRHHHRLHRGRHGRQPDRLLLPAVRTRPGVGDERRFRSARPRQQRVQPGRGCASPSPPKPIPFVQRQAQAGVRGIGGTDSWLDTRRDFLTLDRVFGAFVTVVRTLRAGGRRGRRRRVDGRHASSNGAREIGLLGAVGFTPRQVVDRAASLEHLTRSDSLAAIVVGSSPGSWRRSSSSASARPSDRSTRRGRCSGSSSSSSSSRVILTLATLVPAAGPLDDR